WKTVWRARSGSWNGPTGSGIWITSLRWKSRSAARVTLFVARHLAWRARCSKPAASPCHPRCAHAELTSSSAQAERKRVTRPFSKLQPAGGSRKHHRLPKSGGDSFTFAGSGENHIPRGLPQPCIFRRCEPVTGGKHTLGRHPGFHPRVDDGTARIRRLLCDGGGRCEEQEHQECVFHALSASHRRAPVASKGSANRNSGDAFWDGGEGGIRTPGRSFPLRRFSKPLLSTTQPPLREMKYGPKKHPTTSTAEDYQSEGATLIRR